MRRANIKQYMQCILQCKVRGTQCQVDSVASVGDFLRRMQPRQRHSISFYMTAMRVVFANSKSIRALYKRRLLLLSCLSVCMFVLSLSIPCCIFLSLLLFLLLFLLSLRCVCSFRSVLGRVIDPVVTGVTHSVRRLRRPSAAPLSSPKHVTA